MNIISIFIINKINISPTSFHKDSFNDKSVYFRKCFTEIKIANQEYEF